MFIVPCQTHTGNFMKIRHVFSTGNFMKFRHVFSHNDDNRKKNDQLTAQPTNQQG